MSSGPQLVGGDDDGDDGGGLLGVFSESPGFDVGSDEKLTVQTVRAIVRSMLIGGILLPIVGAILAVFETIIESIQLLILGGDGRLGVAPGSAIGLADLPVFIVATIIDATAPVAAGLLAPIEAFNAAIASVAAQAGLAAFPVATTLVLAEIAVVGYAVWVVANTVDLPIIELGGLIRVALSPIRAFRRLTK